MSDTNQSSSNSHRPRAVLILAIVLIALGVFSAWKAWHQGNVPKMIAGVINIVLGNGLLKLKPAWRTAVLVWLGSLTVALALSMLTLIATKEHRSLIALNVHPGISFLIQFIVFAATGAG